MNLITVKKATSKEVTLELSDGDFHVESVVWFSSFGNESMVLTRTVKAINEMRAELEKMKARAVLGINHVAG